MATLFLSAPKRWARRNPLGYFSAILTRGIGPDYVIYPKLLGQISIGMKVVVFDRDGQMQAQGKLAKYVRRRKASNGNHRYHVYIRHLTIVPYRKPPKVNPCGVGIY